MRKVICYLLVVLSAFTAFYGCESKSKNDDTVKIGVIFPMSGGGKSSGQSAYNALKMCADEWNEKGGVLGKQIELELQDSKGDPKEGTTIAKRMLAIGKKPSIIISAISGVTLNVQTVTENEGVILMGIIGSDDFITEKTSFSLRNFITSKVTSNAILDIVNNDFPQKRFNVAYCNTELGRNFSNVITETAKSRGMEVSDVFSFEENETNYQNVIMKHDFDDNDVIYAIGVDRPLGLFIRQLRQSGFNGTIIGDINIINSSCVDVIGDYMNNICYINVKTEENDEISKYKSLYGHDMDVLAIYCYNGLDLLLSFINEQQNIDNKFIMNNICGYKYNSKFGLIQVENNELNYEHELIRIK